MTEEKVKKKKIRLARIPEGIRNAKIDIEGDMKAWEVQRQKKITQKFSKKHYKLGFFSRRKLSTAPEYSFLITMFFLNGISKTFVIKSKTNTFKIKGKLYYLYSEESFYDLSMAQYHLYYYENVSVPVNREYVKEGEEAFFSVTPENLADLIKFEYVKVLAGAHNMNKMFTFIILLTVINLVVSGIVLLVVLGMTK